MTVSTEFICERLDQAFRGPMTLTLLAEKSGESVDGLLILHLRNPVDMDLFVVGQAYVVKIEPVMAS
jgi:hypothetical protein